MKKTLIFFIIIIFSASGICLSQKKRPYKRNGRTNSFLRTQWWLGFSAGANLTKVSAADTYSTFSPINYEQGKLDKTYEGMKLGGQTGLSVTFYHRGFSFVLEPNFRTRQFNYFNEYEWVSESNPANLLELNYSHQVNLQYIDIPFYLRYDILRGKFRPYVQAGAYYSLLINAKKNVKTSGTDFASGSAGTFQPQEVTLGANELFKSRDYGIVGGVGTAFDIWNVRFILGINYRYGLETINDPANRFSENPLADTGDALDDISLQGWDATLSCVFPLRFISKDLKSTE